MSYTYKRSDEGNQMVSVNCSNLVSWMSHSWTVDVIIDRVNLGWFRYNEPVYWNSTAQFLLNITRFGTGACFELNTGDNTPIVIFQPGLCTGYIATSNQIFQPISIVDQLMNFTYLYKTIGTYQVTVRAFNHINNDSLTIPVVILDWPCEKPNITIDPIYSIDPSKPLAVTISAGLNIVAMVNVSCMKWITSPEIGNCIVEHL